MLTWFRHLDLILRGEVTRPSQLRAGRIVVDAKGLSILIVFLGALYGLCMGWFALFNRDRPELVQLLASMVKVPALFLLTLAVTFPSLYVFNALVGSRLTLLPVLKLLIASIGVNVAVLASLGPIVAFFSVSTSGYGFMVLLNVIVFGIAGTLGLWFLLQTLHRITMVLGETRSGGEIERTRRTPSTPSESGDASPPLDSAEAPAAAPQVLDPTEEPEGALDRTPEPIGLKVITVFYLWVVVFGLVGAQMGWVLRPFVGNPAEPFTWLRKRESNFFEAMMQVLHNLLQ